EPAASDIHTLQRLQDRDLALTPGQTYYVVNRTGNSFQLAATPGGSALAINPNGYTGGSHTCSVEGIDFTGVGSGSHRLVVDIGTGTGAQKFDLVSASAFAGAPSGDG